MVGKFARWEIFNLKENREMCVNKIMIYAFLLCFAFSRVGTAGCWNLLAGSTCYEEFGDFVTGSGCTGCGEAVPPAAPPCNGSGPYRHTVAGQEWYNNRGGVAIEGIGAGFYGHNLGFQLCYETGDCLPECVFDYERWVYYCAKVNRFQYFINWDTVYGPNCNP